MEDNKVNNVQVKAAWLAAIIESADDAIISKTLDGIITSWNPGAAKIFGYSAAEIIGKSILTIIPPDRHHEEDHILGRIRRGEGVKHYETVRLTKDGRMLDVALTVSPIRTEDGTIVGASKILRDISEQKQAERRLHEETEIVETINRIGADLAAELDLGKLVQSVTDAATALVGAEFGSFFYNVLDDEGGSYMLYVLSGVPREAFEGFPMPRNTDLFGPTFRGEGIIRIDNVKKDPRYGRHEPYRGMPSGHLPVTSYLAVPVISRSNEVIGGLFFGHSGEAVFTESHEKIVKGMAGQVATAMDNARLYDNAQKALKEREELLKREQSAREIAEIANRAKDEFLGMLSHELRTPLNSILGWSRLLIESGPTGNEAMEQALEAIDRNAKLQARLIDDMLDVSRIISGKLRLDAQPVDLAVVIHASVDTLRPAAEAKNIRIYVTLDFGAGTVLGDPVRLQQVFWNLLSNAIKFTDKGGSARVALRRINSHVEITVTDSGPGIEEDLIPFVFDRFRQGDSTTRKRFGGLGLGLSIVRHLVELHGGTVEAANRADASGAVFTVTLPVMAVRKTPEPQVAEEREQSEARPAGFDSLPRLKGIRVLAVDDEADARRLLAVLFERCEAEVMTSGSVTEALKLIDDFRPHVLVSDIGMPGEDGYALIRQLREKEQGSESRLPAIALTAFARTEDRLQALSAGYNAYISKPVEPAELALMVYRITG